MAMPSSQNIRSESEMVPELCPVMPVDLFKAVVKGDRNLLIRRLGLEPEEQTECQVTMEGVSHSAPEEISTENQTVQSELQSATPFGDTILHLLVTEGHSELALMVFQRDMSLFKARNNMLETPLHCAAKVGNDKFLDNLIQSDCVVVKDGLAQTNTNGDTALHIAVNNGHIAIGSMIMNLDPKIAFKVKNKLLSPLYLAIVNEHTEIVQTMLRLDPTLACTPFSDGMFPVHEAARTGNVDLIKHFMENYPDEAELRDRRGRNLFHIAAEEKKDFFLYLFNAEEYKRDFFSRLNNAIEKNNNLSLMFNNAAEEKNDLLPSSFKSLAREMIKRMNTATDYEGNTPFHIASIVGDKNNMEAIWRHIKGAEAVRNNQGLTPFQLSVRQLLKTRKDIDHEDLIKDYLETEGYEFTETWFSDVMEPSKYKWEKVQIIGLGSVLITTVTFAAALTIPGDYNQDHGTLVLGRRYMFKAFVLANASAFILGFISLFALLWGALGCLYNTTLGFGLQTFLWAANCMVLAFGLGMYVTLAPVCYPIAVIVLVISLFFGSPYGIVFIMKGEIVFQFIFKYTIFMFFWMVLYAMPFLFIFCLALL